MVKISKKCVFDTLENAEKIVKLYSRKELFDIADSLQYTLDLKVVKNAFAYEDKAIIERRSHSIKTNGSWLYDYDIEKCGCLNVNDYKIIVVQTQCNCVLYILQN